MAAARAAVTVALLFSCPAASPGDTAPVLSVSTTSFTLDIFGNCSAVATNERTRAASKPNNLLTSYNRVADNYFTDWGSCVGASLVAPGVVRVTTAHSGGTIDIGVSGTQGATSHEGWVTFEVRNISGWHADPMQKHIGFGSLCPVDLCTGDGQYPSGAAPTAQGQTTSGKFQGFRGHEDGDSSGWFTVSSEWQFWTTMLFVKPGMKLAYTTVPTASLSALEADIRKAEGILDLSPNRARSWQWGQGVTEANLDGWINHTLAVGAEVLFIGDYDAMLSNIGDYQPDLVKWPSGIGAAKGRIDAAGLEIGLHMIPSGATVCLDQMDKGWRPYGSCVEATCTISCGQCHHGCKGNRVPQQAGGPNIDTKASHDLTHLMVPQGLTPMTFYYANDAALWECHEMKGDLCLDKGKGPSCHSTPMIGCPNATNIQLFNTSWSTLGRYRGGGAILFDGVRSHAVVKHVPCGGIRGCGNCRLDPRGESNISKTCFYPESSIFNFSFNHFYPNISTEFTFQAVVHPLSTKQASDTLSSWPQVIMTKAGEWILQIVANGTLEWHVHLSSGWVVARGTTDLRRSDANASNETYIVKATHAGGVVKLFTCLLGYEFQCAMAMPEGTARGVLPLHTGTADIVFGASSVPSATGEVVQNGFVGALEELQFNRISKENITAHLFNEPGSGCTNYYIWDFTQPAARTHWAKSIAEIYNTVTPIASQWDGSEFQIALNGWGLPHSTRTLSEERTQYFKRATMAAFMESHKLWKEPVAVEFSFSDSGLGPWPGDMTPFADEGRIKPPGDLCEAGNGGVTDGNGWHMEMLEEMLLKGTTVNAYSTPIVWLKTPNGADCWLGKLVGAGVAPQVSGCHYSIPLSPSQHAICDPVVPRVKYWLQTFRRFGAATESSIQRLHEKIYFIGLEGGSDQSVAHFSVYVGNTTMTSIPPVPTNSTLVVCQSFGVPFANLSLPGGTNTALTMFAASNVTVFMSGGFWTLSNANMLETITTAEGTVKSHRWLFPSKVSGAHQHSVVLKVRERVSYAVGPGPATLTLAASPGLKSDDGEAVKAAADLVTQLPFETWIENGVGLWNDTAGRPLHAHGGGMYTEGGKFLHADNSIMLLHMADRWCPGNSWSWTSQPLRPSPGDQACENQSKATVWLPAGWSLPWLSRWRIGDPAAYRIGGGGLVQQDVRTGGGSLKTDDTEGTDSQPQIPPAPPGFAALLVGNSDPRGAVLRPPNFTLTKPNAGWSRWHSAGFFDFQQSYSDFGSYSLTTHYPGRRCVASPSCDPKAVGQTAGCGGSECSGLHYKTPPTIRATVAKIRPNRRYIMAVVVKTNFTRFTTEVNLEVFPYDSDGNAGLMSSLNSTQDGIGLPSNTSSQPGAVDGWVRLEWDFLAPSYPNLAGGALGVSFVFGCGNLVPEVFLADFALIELPVSIRQYQTGEGLSFAGGVGNLPMHVTTCNAAELATASVQYIVGNGTVTVSQLIDMPRVLASWQVSPASALQNLRVLHSAVDRCVLGNPSMSIGVQSDGLIGFVPHGGTNVTLTVTSIFTGQFNRLAYGHLLSEDDFGGFTVSPDPGTGSGRLPRWMVLTPDLQFPALDPYDRNSTPKDAAGWQVAYQLQPGDRIFSAVMPVRQFEWAQSFDYDWWECPHFSGGKEITCEDMLLPNASQAAQEATAIVLWEAAVHENGGGWVGPYVPAPSAAAVKKLVRDVQLAKKEALVYMSMWFSYTRNASAYISHVRQWKNEYGIDGIYSDGLPVFEWLTAYEEARMLRETFPSGTLIFHDSQEGREEGKAAALYRPFIHAYATSTLMGEGTPSEDGSAWQWPRFATAQYRHSGAFGAMKGSKWKWQAESPAPDGPWQDFVQLVFNGRERPVSGGPDATDSKYLGARSQLERVWREHGQSETQYGGESFFYDQYYLPAAQNETELFIGRSPMPIGLVEAIRDKDSTQSQKLTLRAFRSLRPGGIIRYTTDGTAVTKTSAVYSGPLSPAPRATLRAVSFEPELTPSRELTVKLKTDDAAAGANRLKLLFIDDSR